LTENFPAFILLKRFKLFFAIFLQGEFHMPTIAELEQALSDAATAGDMAAITSIVTSLTPEEKAGIDPIMVFGYALVSISIYSFTDPALAASTAGIFMQEVGLYTDSVAISGAFANFGSFGNLAGVNAMVDNTDPQIYPSLDPMALGMAVTQVSFALFSDPAGALATTLNLLSHLSLYTDPLSITFAMQNFAGFGSLDSLSAVIDSIDPQVYPHLDAYGLGFTLTQISNAVFSDPEGAVEAAASFLSHFSLYVDPFSITMTMNNFAQFGLLDGVNAVIDSIDPQVYPSLDSYMLGGTLGSITGFSVLSDPEGAIQTTANFLSHFSLYVEPFSITSAMQNFTAFGVVEGVTAIVDNLDPQVYALLDSYQLGNVLSQVVGSMFSDLDGAVAATADFLSHLSLYTDPSSIAFSIRAFAEAGVLDGVNAVVDNIDPQAYSHLDPGNLGFAMTFIANDTFVLDDHDVAGTLRNFSQKLLPYAGGASIEQSLQTLANDGNLSALGGVLDYLTPAQWDNLSTPFKDSLPGFGITVGTYLDDKYLGSGGVDIYLGLGGADNIDGMDGNDFLFGNAGADKIAGGAGSDFLDGGIGADVLTGGAGSDTFALNNFDGIDKIQDFDKAAGGDILDFRDMLSGYDGSQLVADFVLAHTAGVNTFISFDADGAGAGAALEVAKLQGLTGIDIQALFDNGQILI
jgi:hypothetical protein